MRARDIMTTPVVTVSATTEVAKAATLMADNRFSALPVVDAAGTLVGIVTEYDLVRGRFAESSERTAVRAVADVMTAPAEGLLSGTPVAEVARAMVDRKRRCVPVVDGGGRVVGVVTRRDLVRLLSRSDVDIAIDVRAALTVFGGRSRWTVRVADGVAAVIDRFDDSSDWEVARALAESVSGVVRASVHSGHAGDVDEMS
ncbi:CBS domain-containing protein [Actinokineospora sp. HUAS TT18]|uniref:CBS domain-containing protein n=1 Tax=Actinokineospora sp. HUAS TT18 TaxID=3447451 RepID=UPI003F51EC03